LVTIFLERGKLGKELVSLNQSRISHQAKHLSCISTTEGKHLDPVYLSPPLTKEHLSFDRSMQEEPTKQDWLNWERFWHTYCNRFLELTTLLGDWLVLGHKIWPWLLDVERDVVFCQNYQDLKVYIPLVKQTTRTGSLYTYLGEVNIIPTKVVPISISNITDDVVSVKGESPPLKPLWSIRPTFWDSLLSRGREWMWDYVSDRTTKPLWLKTALEEGMAILVTNGSCSWTRGLDVCGAGWEIARQKSRKFLNGSFYEFSSNASAYRGELLGLVALHTLTLHVCQYYHLMSAQGKTICDSKSAFEQIQQTTLTD
jgi:hypothetical protein